MEGLEVNMDANLVQEKTRILARYKFPRYDL